MARTNAVQLFGQSVQFLRKIYKSSKIHNLYSILNINVKFLTFNNYNKKISYEEILKRSPRRELLNEYACHLVKYHPHLKHDVLSKLNFLNKQWKSIEFSIISKRFHNEDITKGVLFF